jgi:hypothetical protein
MVNAEAVADSINRMVAMRIILACLRVLRWLEIVGAGGNNEEKSTWQVQRREDE